MSTTIRANKKVIPSRRALVIGVIAFVSIALAALFVSIMTAQTIAPPGLRIMDLLWRLFH